MVLRSGCDCSLHSPDIVFPPSIDGKQSLAVTSDRDVLGVFWAVLSFPLFSVCCPVSYFKLGILFVKIHISNEVCWNFLLYKSMKTLWYKYALPFHSKNGEPILNYRKQFCYVFCPDIFSTDNYMYFTNILLPIHYVKCHATTRKIFNKRCIAKKDWTWKENIPFLLLSVRKYIQEWISLV